MKDHRPDRASQARSGYAASNSQFDTANRGRRDPGGYRKVWRFREGLWVFLLLLILTASHYFLIVLLNESGWPTRAKLLVPLIYWVILASLITVIINWTIQKRYGDPVRKLGDAAEQVSRGDFSIYIKPRHTEDKMDFIDALYQDFNKMVEALGSMETMKTEFFANVSHELKAPLARLQSSLELLKGGTLSEEEAGEELDAALAASRHMGDLIANLLRLNKLEKQSIPLMPTDYDVCAQLCECALGFEAAWEDKGLEFEADLEDRAYVTADEELMLIVWNNLISNAVKFTEPGGRVTIRESTADGEVTVRVEDTGCGMSEETIGRVFEKFYQGDTSHSTEGNGLGLALVDRVLRLTGGTIDVESRLGVGSAFTVRLPAGEAPAPNPTDPETQIL